MKYKSRLTRKLAKAGLNKFRYREHLERRAAEAKRLQEEEAAANRERLEAKR